MFLLGLIGSLYTASPSYVFYGATEKKVSEFTQGYDFNLWHVSNQSERLRLVVNGRKCFQPIRTQISYFGGISVFHSAFWMAA